MIKFINVYIYAFLDPCANRSFVTPYIAISFDITSKELLEHFCVSTPFGESIVVESVYLDYTIFVNHKYTKIDLVKLNMMDFDIVLGIDWLHACYALFDSKTQEVKF